MPTYSCTYHISIFMHIHIMLAYSCMHNHLNVQKEKFITYVLIIMHHSSFFLNEKILTILGSKTLHSYELLSNPLLKRKVILPLDRNPFHSYKWLLNPRSKIQFLFTFGLKPSSFTWKVVKSFYFKTKKMRKIQDLLLWCFLDWWSSSFIWMIYMSLSPILQWPPSLALSSLQAQLYLILRPNYCTSPQTQLCLALKPNFALAPKPCIV